MSRVGAAAGSRAAYLDQHPVQRDAVSVGHDGAFHALLAAVHLRGAGTLILSGRTSFLANNDYWVSYPDTPAAPATRRAFAELIAVAEKYVVSNAIDPQDPAPWQDTTRIIRSSGLYSEIAALKARPRRPVLLQLSTDATAVPDDVSIPSG